MRCILQLYSPNCSTTAPAQAASVATAASASLAYFAALPLPSTTRPLLLQFCNLLCHGGVLPFRSNSIFYYVSKLKAMQC